MMHWRGRKDDEIYEKLDKREFFVSDLQDVWRVDVIANNKRQNPRVWPSGQHDLEKEGQRRIACEFHWSECFWKAKCAWRQPIEKSPHAKHSLGPYLWSIQNIEQFDQVRQVFKFWCFPSLWRQQWPLKNFMLPLHFATPRSNRFPIMPTSVFFQSILFGQNNPPIVTKLCSSISS